MPRSAPNPERLLPRSRLCPLLAGGLLLLALGATSALAAPPVVTVEGADDDARVTLSAYDRTMLGDVRAFCEVRARVSGAGVEIAAGDTAELLVFEDDLVGDDPLWSMAIEFSADEIQQQRLDRTFDCSVAFPDDFFGEDLELKARLQVTKANCGFFCGNDSATTPAIAIDEVEDDDQEPDDAVRDARALPLGLTANLHGMDPDFAAFELLGPTRILYQVEHLAQAGRLEITLFASDGSTRVADGRNEPGATVLDVPFLERGTYYLRVTPREGNDFSFYDARFAVAAVEQDCRPGLAETEVCGNCGTRERTCNDMGEWGPFGMCEGEGICAPGERREDPCGLCGVRASLCTDTCEWMEAAECEGEGICLPADVETAPCDGAGERTRFCSDDCEWSEFSPCEGEACAEGTEEACYTGPAGTEGIGACAPGLRSCIGGAFGPCEGERLPAEEICDDGIDNDCNGGIDDEDAACGGGSSVGSACESTEDCASPFECVGPPEHPVFVGGYCGLTGCDANCGPEAACVRIFALQYCLKRCDRQADCRDGYLCEPVGASRVCAPACTEDSHCRDAARSMCDQASGRCVEEGVAPPPDAGMNQPADQGLPRDFGPGLSDVGMSGESDEVARAACECRTTPAGPVGWLALLALLGMRFRIGRLRGRS